MTKGVVAGLVCGTAAMLAAGAPASAQTIESAYTALNTERCRHVRGREPEDYGYWTCRGYGGVAVRVAAGDQRVTVSFGPRAKDEPAASETLAAFNSEGKTIEWRIERSRNGKRLPFAAILRWNTTTSDERGATRGQVLVVTRLGPGGMCHVGYVDGRANTRANELAREIADKHARGFRCGTDKAIVLGEKGPGFSGPMSGEN